MIMNIKVLLIVSACLFIFYCPRCFSQQDTSSKSSTEEALTIVDEMPVFPGGFEKYITFLQQNIIYPQLAKDSLIEGTVYIEFIVEKDGNISNIMVKPKTKKVGGGCEEEALRVVRMMPKWNPGKQKGKPVRVKMILPVKFKL